MSIDWDTWDCKCGAYGAGPDNHNCPLKERGGLKERLAKLRETFFLDDIGAYQYPTKDETLWLITQLELAWKREEIARKALNEINEPFPSEVPECDFNQGMKVGHAISANTSREALAKMESIK